MNYSSIYCALISKRLQNPLSKRDCYCEKHHIIPKSEGGSNLNENLVNLTAREHFVAHLLLARIYNDNKMWRALNRLVHGNRKNYTKVTSRLYTKIKTQYSQIMSEKQKGNKFFLGKHHSEESKKKMAKAKIGKTWNRGKVRSEEYKKRMSEIKKGSVPWNKGKKHSDEAKAKMSVAQKGQHWFNNGVKCVRCKECPVGFKPGRLIKTNKSK